MESIVNNLKKYNRDLHSKSPLRQLSSDGQNRRQNRRILPRTQAKQNRQMVWRNQSRMHQRESRQNPVIKIMQATSPESVGHQLPGSRSKDRVRKSIFRKQLVSPRPSDTCQVKKSAQSIRINELFFCQECYLFLFGIQLAYHHPVCKDSLNKTHLSPEQRLLLGENRLLRLQQAVKYTNFAHKQTIISDLERIREGCYSSRPGGYQEHNGKTLLLKDVERVVELVFGKFFRVASI